MAAPRKPSRPAGKAAPAAADKPKRKPAAPAVDDLAPTLAPSAADLTPKLPPVPGPDLSDIKTLLEEVLQQKLEQVLSPFLSDFSATKETHEKALAARDNVILRILEDGLRLRRSPGTTFCEIADKGGYTIGSGEDPMTALRNALTGKAGK